MTEDGEAIYIESTRDPTGAGAACLLRWGVVEKYAPVADVRQTAEDLMTCAAYADLVGELLRVGLDGQLIVEMTQAMLHQRQPKFFGAMTTLFLLPAGSSARKQGMVLLARRDLFHQGKADACVTPDEARTMARYWLTAAEASEADTLFGAVLERSGWMQAAELDALFGLLKDIRGGVAELPPHSEELHTE